MDTLDLQLMSTAEIRRLQADYRHLPSPAAALSGVSGPAGGFLAPETLAGRYELNMLAHGPMRRVAEIIRTADGGDLYIPKCDDTANIGTQLGESTDLGSSTDPAFSATKFGAYKYSSLPIRFPYSLMEDAPLLMMIVLGDILGERLSRITNRKFTVGTGAATPLGIVPAAPTVAAASATAISFDDVAKLEHAVDPAYREGAAFMAHDDVVAVLRGLKDGAGRYLFADKIEPGAPYMLRGRPLYVNQDMDASIASGKKTLLFGQLFKYKIRSVGVLRLMHLVERYRDSDDEAAIAFIREDGNLLSGGNSPVKVLVH